jgi:hypothetical protein
LHAAVNGIDAYAISLIKQKPPWWRTALVHGLAKSPFANRISEGLWASLNSDPAWLGPTYFAGSSGIFW